MKNFALGLEWVWTKNKFLDRKVDMSEFWLDFKEDGKIDQQKYQVKLVFTILFLTWIEIKLDLFNHLNHLNHF